ncbi:MAG: hypothetical protein JXX28_13595 [Deltaproteobacteria bacterium]|nr:hypothetical protein [Deltaproteobacteria bacterium]
MRITVVTPGSFVLERHYYPRVPNARIHPIVRSFLKLGNDRIAQRYSHLHPEAEAEAVRGLLSTPTRYLRWAGADLFHVTDERGVRQNIIIETNSSPSGQKSMPLLDDDDDLGGYRRLIERSFLPMLRRRALPRGRLAVLWDKNEMETTGYAAAIADLTGEDVLLVHLPAGDDAGFRWEGGVLEVEHGGAWVPIRAAFRYVTQRPWTRIPPITRTALLNPVVACLAGGRNKLVAAKAYAAFNQAWAGRGLAVRFPETIQDVTLGEVPGWVAHFGGVAVVKDPYSNAGQGVWTITRPGELSEFMGREHRYQRFVVQGLVGNRGWTSDHKGHRLYHVGTVPDRAGRIFVADLRFTVGQAPEGAYPVAIYARRAREPLAEDLASSPSSWAMLGTNLSVKLPDGRFTTEPERLMLVDERDFGRLGLGLDDLTEAYLQAVMAMHAIDAMASALISAKGAFRERLFATLNPDPALLKEVMR